ncbi:D-aminoacyl-tRNA deacylase 1-like [Centruroides sculpturatus]|uniref:D-aminoacyl-tRNA deacylase 1-like n=1 Tax=Centruroides sculpturatus TaxID=218467 RepID=UPI000C6CA48F|nr:D-aminoacyl-tRNA deacylase 1-like [Centruroides sculpturatus]
MRAIVQRVTGAAVKVNGEIISSIGKGICVLVGITRVDTRDDLEYMVRKLLNLRIFEDDNGKRWSHSVKDKQYEILCVSQFTLYCTLKGNKPDFHLSMAPDRSQPFYEEFVERLKNSYKPELVKDGKFGAFMNVELKNEGPVTIQIESPSNQPKKLEYVETASNTEIEEK